MSSIETTVKTIQILDSRWRVCMTIHTWKWSSIYKWYKFNFTPYMGYSELHAGVVNHKKSRTISRFQPLTARSPVWRTCPCWPVVGPAWRRPGAAPRGWCGSRTWSSRGHSGGGQVTKCLDGIKKVFTWAILGVRVSLTISKNIWGIKIDHTIIWNYMCIYIIYIYNYIQSRGLPKMTLIFFWLWNFALEFACLWNLWKYCVVFSTGAELVRIGIFEIVILRLQLFEAPVNYDFEIPGLLCGVRGGLDWIPLSCQVGARSPWFFFSLSFSNLRFFWLWVSRFVGPLPN